MQGIGDRTLCTLTKSNNYGVEVFDDAIFLSGINSEKFKNIWFFVRFALTLASPKIHSLENSQIIWNFTHLFVSLHPEYIL